MNKATSNLSHSLHPLSAEELRDRRERQWDERLEAMLADPCATIEVMEAAHTRYWSFMNYIDLHGVDFTPSQETEVGGITLAEEPTKPNRLAAIGDLAISGVEEPISQPRLRFVGSVLIAAIVGTVLGWLYLTFKH